MTDAYNTKNEELPRLREALERVRPDIERLSEAELLPINLDPLEVATTVSGALAGLLAMRGDIESTFKVFDFSCLDKLENYVLALIQAETVCRGTAVKAIQLSELAQDGYALRCRLIADVKLLVTRGLLTAPRLAKQTGPNGYRATAADLLTLATLLREHWTLIERNSPVHLDEVERAERVGDQLLHAIGTRDKSSPRWIQAAEQRARAYALVVRAYGELRCAIEYLRRHHGDIETIAPSLYKKRRAQRKKPNTNDVVSAIEQNTPKDEQTKSVERFNDGERSDDDPFVH